MVAYALSVFLKTPQIRLNNYKITGKEIIEYYYIDHPLSPSTLQYIGIAV